MGIQPTFHLVVGKCNGVGFYKCRQESTDNCSKCKHFEYQDWFKEMGSEDGFEAKED